MDWQTLFYFVGTIFMIVALGMLIAFAVFLYYVRQRIEVLSKLAERPYQTASDIGEGIAEGVALKILQWTKQKAS